MGEQFALWLTVIMTGVLLIGVTWILTDRIVELRHRVNKLEINQRLDEYATRVVETYEDGTYTTEQTPIPRRKLIMLTKEECADIWADAHDIEGKMIWTPAQLFEQIMNRIKEKNLG